jgi:hypothetical protein
MKLADSKPWETVATYGRADLRLHPLVREAYKVACLIEDCGGSPELTLASSTAFALCESLSDHMRNFNELQSLVEQFDDGHTAPEEFESSARDDDAKTT